MGVLEDAVGRVGDQHFTQRRQNTLTSGLGIQSGPVYPEDFVQLLADGQHRVQ